MRAILSAGLMVVFAGMAMAASAELQPVGGGRWVFVRGDGKLGYGKMAKGDHIMDFSSAGYHGGGVKIPTVAVVKTISASGGDDSKTIQDAIDEVAKRPLDHGVRGAILLRAGTYNCGKAIEVKASGVVLRGGGWDGDPDDGEAAPGD